MTLTTRRSSLQSRMRTKKTTKRSGRSKHHQSLFLIQALNAVFTDVSLFAQKQGKTYYPMSAEEFFQELYMLFAAAVGNRRSRSSQRGGSFLSALRISEFFATIRDTGYLTIATTTGAAVGSAIVGDFDTPCNAILSSIWLISYSAMAYNATATQASASIRRITEALADPVRTTILQYFEMYAGNIMGSSGMEQLTSTIEYMIDTAARRLRGAPESATRAGIRHALNWCYRKLPTALFVKTIACICMDAGIESCSAACLA